MSWNDEANIRCILRFQCPQVWSLLSRGERNDERHCHECGRTVFLVKTEHDFHRRSAVGECVAIPVHNQQTFFEANHDVVVGVPEHDSKLGFKEEPSSAILLSEEDLVWVQSLIAAVRRALKRPVLTGSQITVLGS